MPIDTESANKNPAKFIALQWARRMCINTGATYCVYVKEQSPDPAPKSDRMEDLNSWVNVWYVRVYGEEAPAGTILFHIEILNLNE